MKSMEKREREFLQTRFIRIPEIQDEIKSYLERYGKQMAQFPFEPKAQFPISSPFQSKTLSATLEEALVRLQQIGNVQEILKEPDMPKLIRIYGEFEGIKSIARLVILTMRSYIELGLTNWGRGPHTIRDEAGHILRECWMVRLWAANILPCFEVPARICVAYYEPTRRRAAFSFGLSAENISTACIQVELPQTWTDPLEKCLRHVDLFQEDPTVTFDGIGYELFSRSKTNDMVIQFANPTISPYTDLAKAFWDVAETITMQTGQVPETEYMTKWQKYRESL